MVSLSFGLGFVAIQGAVGGVAVQLPLNDVLGQLVNHDAASDMRAALRQLGVPNVDPTPAQCRDMSNALAANADFMAQVRSFYKSTYWDGFRGDDIPYEIAYYLFQYAVNTGTAVTAGKLLQSQLNFMNKNGLLFPNLAVDGHPGNATLSGLGKVLQRQDGQGVLMALMRSEAVQHYKKIMLDDPSQEEFCYGWINRSQVIER